MIIYKVTNQVNKKVYIGKTKNTLRIRRQQHYYEINDLKSSFHNALTKYSPESFIWEMIDAASSLEELDQKEKYWIKYFRSREDGIGYNIGVGGEGGDNFSNNPKKEEIRKYIGSQVRLSKRWTEEKRKEASEKMKGPNNPMKLNPQNSIFIKDNPMKKEEYKRYGSENPMNDIQIRKYHKEIMESEEHRKKLSIATKGQKKSPITEEHRRNLSLAHQGKVLSEEHRKKISEAGLGRVVSVETRRKQSESSKGRVFSEESRKKLSEAKKKYHENRRKEISSVQR